VLLTPAATLRSPIATARRPPAAGRRDDAAGVADQSQAGGLAQPSDELLLKQRQHLVRYGRHGQPISQLSSGGAAPNLLYRHRPVTQFGRRHRQERRRPPRLEVHADGPGREWIAELQRAGVKVTTQPSAYSAICRSSVAVD